MARQSKREVAETPLWSVNKVVNVASSMVTMQPIRSGPCSGMRRVIALFVSQEYPRGMVTGTESVKAESTAVWALALRAFFKA